VSGGGKWERFALKKRKKVAKKNSHLVLPARGDDQHIEKKKKNTSKEGEKGTRIVAEWR